MSVEKYSLQADSAWNPGIYPDPEGEYVTLAEYQKVQTALYDMVFAYCNKSETIPHTFEIHAVASAVDFLDGTNKKFAEEVLSGLGAGQI
jgi:hypothetical protein